MRTIQISTETFAAIWKAQQPGEASEEAILRRLLAVPADVSKSMAERDLKVSIGVYDARYGVKLPPDFKIFRTYNGRDYSARAIQGFWVLDQTGIGYGTLNELSAAIGIANENAWLNWHFEDGGRRKKLSVLRDPNKIVRRNKSVGARAN